MTPAEETDTLPIRLNDRVADISPLRESPLDATKIPVDRAGTRSTGLAAFGITIAGLKADI